MTLQAATGCVANYAAFATRLDAVIAPVGDDDAPSRADAYASWVREHGLSVGARPKCAHKGAVVLSNLCERQCQGRVK